MMRPSMLPRAAAPARLFQLASPSTTILRSVPFCRRITTESTTPTTPSASPIVPPTSSATTIRTPEVPRPAFLVSRTPSKQLPVYHLAKRGGNLKSTVVKKIEGDIRALKALLKQDLGLKEDKQIKINHVTGHIEISGHRKDDVTKFLLKYGF